MKKSTITSLIFLLIVNFTISAQEADTPEKFGKTLNLGLGLGYYGYVGHAMPVVHADFEIDVARNFTLAPFITYYSYQNNYYWGNKNYPDRYYYYRQTVIPFGVKGSYYFDEFLKAGPKWDFYLAASLGYAIRKTTWEDGYYGETTIARGASGLYLDAHIGAEYHLGQKGGLFLDLSSGISTIGVALYL